MRINFPHGVKLVLHGLRQLGPQTLHPAHKIKGFKPTEEQRKRKFRWSKLHSTLQGHNTENSKPIFPEKELHGFSPCC
jgi:hypothetical protein